MRRAVTALALAAAAGAARGEAPRGRPADWQHGQVVLDTFTRPLGQPAVVFDHSLHRARHTCRVCHVDLAFALKAGETQVSASTNEAGSHCGACHDGAAHPDGTVVFRACSGWPAPDPARGCTRCHAGAPTGPSPAYLALKERLPLDDAGFIDWEAAERRQLVRPSDAVTATAKRSAMPIDRDVTLVPAGTWLTPVTFSHQKHARWNGCGMCHPELFPLGRRTAARPKMDAILGGQSCGACHLRVAFPLVACRRCHADERPPLR